MRNDIQKIMEELAISSDKIIVNPSTLEELKSQGIPFDIVPSPTIDELFEQRRIKAKENAPLLPILPEGLPPSIQALYQEIRECIFFGLNGAAITMSSILIEYAIKYATHVKESGGHDSGDPDKWDEFEEMELSPAINRAKRAKRLHSFRTTIRNPYNHYNIKKITKNVAAQKVKRLYVHTGQVEEVDIEAENSPMIQTQAKPFMDEHHVLPVFHFADEVVKYFLQKIR
ncbi:MAG: hypothetical protein SV062_08585 [Thermodesulfobacteriota bacterium]|nr:hypothetical protein [Thermodesulfobacteriota bacterium]